MRRRKWVEFIYVHMYKIYVHFTTTHHTTHTPLNYHIFLFYSSLSTPQYIHTYHIHKYVLKCMHIHKRSDFISSFPYNNDDDQNYLYKMRLNEWMFHRNPQTTHAKSPFYILRCYDHILRVLFVPWKNKFDEFLHGTTEKPL